MKALKNVVIGTSLTDHSDGIVRTGLAIAKATGATPWLIHAGSITFTPEQIPHAMNRENSRIDMVLMEPAWHHEPAAAGR